MTILSLLICMIMASYCVQIHEYGFATWFGLTFFSDSRCRTGEKKEMTISCLRCYIKLNDFFRKFKFCPWCHSPRSLISVKLSDGQYVVKEDNK